jgi:hypothetical protein
MQSSCYTVSNASTLIGRTQNVRHRDLGKVGLHNTARDWPASGYRSLGNN